ncbi:MAG: ABC transporter ATP-binding protein, partial [Coriobacteriales bacterium]|nr:ABC transporter ATP-binding protein [Coriobacteriales bacterium]
MLKLYGKYCKGLYGFAILCVVCIALSTLAELFIPKLMSDIVDDAIMPGLFDVAIQISIYMFIFAILSVAFSVASSYLSAKVTLSFGRNVRQSIYTKVCDFAIEDFNSIGTSSLITRTTNDVTQLERFLSMVFGVFVKAPCMLIISVILCFTTSPKISLVVLLAIPFICIGVFIVIKFCVPLMRSLQSKIDAINLVSRENLTGVRVIRAFCKQAFETHRFDLANKDLTDTTVKVTRIIVSIIPLITLILNIVMIAVVWNGAGLISAGELEVGQMMAIIQYSAMLLISVILLSMIFMLWPRAMAACLRINEILEKEVSVKDNDASDDSHIKITGQCVQGVPVVQFKNVNFTYPTAKHNSLSNINLDFELG